MASSLSTSISFPSSPYEGQSHVHGAATYEFSGGYWRLAPTQDSNLVTTNTTQTVTANKTWSGTNAFTGAVTMSQTLAVTGAVTFGNALAVTGATTLTGALAANGGVTSTTVAATGLVTGKSRATGGNTDRTFADHFSDVVNVKDFGALGDGSTDDSSAIASALSTGKCVYFPSGTYVLGGTITIPTHSSIRGAGRAVDLGGTLITGTKFKFNSSNPNTVMFDLAAGGKRISIQDCTLEAYSSTASGVNGGIGIRFNSNRECLVQNVSINGFRDTGGSLGTGIYMHNSTANCCFNTFVGVVIENCFNALDMDSLNASYSCGYNHFYGLTIYQEQNCLRLKSTSANGSIYNNFYGLTIQGDSGPGAGIYVEGSGNTFHDVVVDNGSSLNPFIEFNKTTSSNNWIRVITGPAFGSNVVDNRTSGGVNTIVSSSYETFTPIATGTTPTASKKSFFGNTSCEVLIQSSDSAGLSKTIWKNGTDYWTQGINASSNLELSVGGTAFETVHRTTKTHAFGGASQPSNGTNGIALKVGTAPSASIAANEAYLYVDSSGKLRLKFGATDVVVGTQT